MSFPADLTLTAKGTPISKKVGYGTGVSVYKLSELTPNGKNFSSPWALKKITTKSRLRNVVKERLHKEAELLRTLNHSCIIKLKYNSENVSESISLEYGGDSLASILEKIANEKCELMTLQSYLSIISSILDALHYLHNEAFILHGDIKSENILVNTVKGTTKLCDFGVSLMLKPSVCGKYLVRKDSIEPYVGSKIYRPKEVDVYSEFEEDVPVTDRCDVWCFGLVLYEMISLTPPYLNHIQALKESATDLNDFDFDSMLDQYIGTRPEVSDFPKIYEPLLVLFQVCTEVDYTIRPPVSQVLFCYHSTFKQ